MPTPAARTSWIATWRTARRNRFGAAPISRLDSLADRCLLARDRPDPLDVALWRRMGWC